MKFRASIHGCVALTTYGGQPSNVHKPFIFDENKIWFSSEHKMKEYFLTIALVCGFGNGASYQIERAKNKIGKEGYKITIGNDSRCVAFLRMSWINRVKCNYIHRHKFKGEKNWRDRNPFLNDLRTGAITALFSLIVGIILFRIDNRETVRENNRRDGHLNRLSDSIKTLQQQIKDSVTAIRSDTSFLRKGRE